MHFCNVPILSPAQHNVSAFQPKFLTIYLLYCLQHKAGHTCKHWVANFFGRTPKILGEAHQYPKSECFFFTWGTSMENLKMANNLSATRLAVAGALVAIATGALAEAGADAWKASHNATSRAYQNFCDQTDCKGERAARIAEANAVTERRHAYTFTYQTTREAEILAFKAAQLALQREQDAEKERQRLAALAEQERQDAQDRADIAALKAVADPHWSWKH